MGSSFGCTLISGVDDLHIGDTARDADARSFDGAVVPPRDAGEPPLPDADSNSMSPDTSKPSGPEPKRVFVTSAQWTGNLGGLTKADDLCKQAATAADAGLDGTEWSAWLSAANVNGISRLPYAGPYELLNGTRVVDSAAELVSGVLKHAIDVTEANAPVPDPGQARVWTGTTAQGQATTQRCANWATGSFFEFGSMGSLAATGPEWTTGASDRCSSAAHLYCFER